ncbi:class I SAM-dependent methyltransferase [Candidatus Symbiobacter mobilis]|uniref:SAM-dependent methyltransferase n=1 Tax=Candidatus Symbiobacter mobilis CR TaxID=946483 RepID=U5N8M4_9BURK|nr:class I SAM-dependent methyltransferase [Candidatus Symbiobacter mobilis]AGX86618.1 SAM-dependent methyltransferase [Candidatus Symbiobacter mobilis CR]
MEDEWFGEGYEARKSSVWVEWFEAWNNRKTLARLAAHSRQGNRLLEIGVGSGSFLKVAKTKGFDVMGCDLSAPICRHVERECGIAMHCGFLSELPDDRQCDAVVMNHVLEHVQQPVEFLQDVFRLLKPEGIVHIAVPNIDCWEACLPGWTSYEPYHLTYFNRQTLLKAVEAAGFSAERVLTSDSFSGWFLALLRTALGINRTQGVVTRPVAASENRPANSRSGWVEHAYRLAMVVVGGGAMAAAMAARQAGLWRRGYMYRAQNRFASRGPVHA